MTATLAAPAPATAPLSRWLADEAGRYLHQGHERGLLVARVLSDLAAEVRMVESPGAAPLSVEQALDRLSALQGEDD